MTTVTKRSLAYDAIYGSDIFNLLPQKVKQNTTCANQNNPSSSTQMKNALSSKDIFYKRNKKDNHNNKENLLSPIPTKSNYCKYLSEFHNINIVSPSKCLPQSSKGILKNELKNSNTSYMLISGCEKSNYQELREELENNFDLEDMLNMKRFYSMNLIKTSDGYSSFITKLPGKIGK